MNTIISANEFVLKLFFNTEPGQVKGFDRENFQTFMKAISTDELKTDSKSWKCSRYNFHVFEEDEHLIYNTLYNSFIRLEGDEYQEFISCEAQDDLRKIFIENGLWIPEDVDEFGKYIILSDAFNKYMARSYSFTLTPTMKCNARCKYCYETGALMNDFNDEKFETLIEFITGKDLTRGVNFNWFGGEPLMNVKFIDKVINAMNERNINYGSYIITNGSMLNSEIIDEKINDWNVHDVQITIDGTEKEYIKRKNYINKDEGDYYKLLKNIISLAKKDVYIHIRLNIDRENVEDILRLVRDLEALYDDYKNVVFYPAFITGCDEKLTEDEKVETVYKLLKNLRNPQRLTAGTKMYSYPRIRPCMREDTNSFSIDSNGYIYSCEHWVGQNKKSVGSIDDINFEKKVSESLSFNDECKECKFFPKCMGGCEANYLSGDAPCMIEKYIIQAYLRYMLY